MIKFMMSSKDNEKRKVFGMIISRGNIDNLIKGFPIHFNCEQMTLEKIECHEVMIAFYETEEEAVKYMKDNGLLDGATIRVEPRTKQ